MAYGDTWIKSVTGPSDLWRPIITSSDGSYIYASNETDNAINVSLDYGVTYNPITVQPANTSRYVVGCSADGQIVYSIATDGSSNVDLYKSTDAGTSWTKITPSGYSYGGIPVDRGFACSSDGQTIYTFVTTDTVFNDPHLFKSTDAGANWTENTVITYVAATNIGIGGSADGNVILIYYYDNIADYVYSVSTDGGASFSASPDLTNIAPLLIRMSGDGEVQYVSCSTGVYLSINYGITFTLTSLTEYSYGLSCSSNGKYAVNLNERPIEGDAQIYVTENYGVNWTAVDSPFYWTSAVMSSDATIIIASVFADGIYYSLNSFMSIISIDPDSGPTVGGTPVTITGSGFDPAATAAIDGNDLTDLVVVDPTTITGITPAGTVGAKDVTVTNP